MDELALIEAIGASLSARGDRVARWLGDDAAVFAPPPVKAACKASPLVLRVSTTNELV